MTENITVVGGGVMGSGIAQVFLQSGYHVTIRDVDESQLEDANERIVRGNYGLEQAVEGGYLTAQEKNAALDRLECTLDLEHAVADTDAVIEAIPEDLAMKGRVFKELDAVTDDVPLYSNTSGFSITGIANAVEDPSRVAGLHFFNPAQVIHFVEIIQTSQTAEAVVKTATTLATDAEKSYIVIDDAPGEWGFVANRCFFRGLKREAEQIVDEGVATEEQVDTALEEGFNLPVGPFKFKDLGEEWD